MHSHPESKCFGTWSSFLEDLKEQRTQALGDDNRYYFYLEHKRLPTDDEAMAHYEDRGGPEAFSQTHPRFG